MRNRMSISRSCCGAPSGPTYTTLTSRFNYWTWQTTDAFCTTSGDIDPLTVFPAAGLMYASASNCTPPPVRYYEWGLGVAVFNLNFLASRLRIRVTANATAAPHQYATSTVNAYYDLTPVTVLSYTTPINRADMYLVTAGPLAWSWTWGITQYIDLDEVVQAVQADAGYTLGDPFRVVIRPVDLMTTSGGTTDLDAQSFNSATASAEAAV